MRITIVSMAALLAVDLATAAPPNFADDILPIFKSNCLNCHNPDKRKADLDLSSVSGIQSGSSGGEVAKPGVPDSSPLFMAIDHHEDYEPMPPKKTKLPDEQIALVRQWILDGMVERSGGASKLRKIEFDVRVADSGKPEGPPPMPQKLPPTEAEKTLRPPVTTALACSPWAPLLAVSGHEQIILRHSENGAPLGALPFPEGTVHVLRFSRNGSLLLAAGGRGAHSGKAVLFDVKSGRRIAEFGDEQDSVLAADISADHRFVAIGGPAKMVKIFDASNGERLHRIDKHTDWITALAFAPQGDLLASADRNGGIHVWEAGKGAIVYSLTEHKTSVGGLAWRADSKMLASAAEDGKFVLWDMKDGWPSKVVDAHKSKTTRRYSKTTGVLSIDFFRDGRIITSGRDRALRIWDASGKRIARVENLDHLPLGALFVDDGRVASGSLAGELHFWTIDKTSLTPAP